ncbi:MAG: hypothetical protein RBU37_12685 [Myxococcota bacterium]|jgi:hypothetical protein|nr:hypothetical protein [Myxococcota bacterium]
MSGAGILVLEDESYRIEIFEELFAPAQLFATADVSIFLKQAMSGKYTLMCLDHDLCDDAEAPTGYDAVSELGRPSGPYFKASCHVPVLLHSLNPRAGGPMLGALWAWEAAIVRIPFHRVPEYAALLRSLAGL